MTYPCSGCGLMRCQGECYDESPSEPMCWRCHSTQLNDDGECIECLAYAERIARRADAANERALRFLVNKDAA